MKSKPLIIRDLVAKIPLIQGGMGVGVSLSNRIVGQVGNGNTENVGQKV